MYLNQPKCTVLPFSQFKKCHGICKNMIEITYLITKTGSKKQHAIQEIQSKPTKINKKIHFGEPPLYHKFLNQSLPN